MTSPRRLSIITASVAVLGLGAIAYAQIEGNDRGVPAIDSSANFEVGGITVDVAAPSAELARQTGWRVAQHRAWRQLWARANNAQPAAAPDLSDGQLESIVAGISVEDEQIGARRYIARLGVLFDRSRAAHWLGGSSTGERSVPMLVIPVMWSGGAPQSFEHRTQWQKAWARFRSGGSPIDYVRPVGTGIDPLVLNVAQAGRPGRGRWRTLLDLYGASDIVVPTVRLVRLYPGGPVQAHFTAIHGPDGDVIAQFTLSAADGDGVPHMLDEGVRRIDEAYSAALRDGRLRYDTSLASEPAAVPDLPEEAPPPAGDVPAAALPGGTSTFQIQIDTPDDASLVQAQAAIRAIPGVTAVNADSVALGGVSVMRVGFAGEPDAFRTALASAGYSVEDTGGGIRLRRAR